MESASTPQRAPKSLSDTLTDINPNQRSHFAAMAEFGMNVALGIVSNTQLTTEDIPELDDETLSPTSPTMNDSFEEFRH
jgi:hypothetical protein